MAALVVVLILVYRALRLRRFTAREHLEVVLSSAGIHTGGLVVPWSEVEGVVRFGFAFGPGRGGPGHRSFVAVRVTDFVAVRGMSPVRAGLANLTRRHLLVLCEAREVHDPTAFANALDELVANPVARELLSGAEGERLVATGPPGGSARAEGDRTGSAPALVGPPSQQRRLGRVPAEVGGEPVCLASLLGAVQEPEQVGPDRRHLRVAAQ